MYCEFVKSVFNTGLVEVLCRGGALPDIGRIPEMKGQSELILVWAEPSTAPQSQGACTVRRKRFCAQLSFDRRPGGDGVAPSPLRASPR